MAKDFQHAEGQRIVLVRKQQKQIIRLYKEIVQQIHDESQRLKGRTNVSSILRKQYLDDMVAEIEQNVYELNQQLEKNIKINMLAMSNVVVEDNRKMLRKMGMDLQQAYLYVPQDIVSEIVTGKLYEGRWSLSSTIWSDSKRTLQDINSIVAKGVAENKSAYEIAKDLEQYVQPSARRPWEWAKVYPNVKKIIDYNAQRLARTMVSHAYEESFVRVTKNNPFIDAYRWLISNSDRVCPVCIARSEDDQYGLGAGIYPKDQLPLDHPNGMCTFESVRTKDYDQIADVLADWVQGQGSKKMNQQIDTFAYDLLGRKTNATLEQVKKSIIF